MTWVAGSLSDAAAIEDLVTGAMTAVHVAGVVRATDPSVFETANVLGTYAFVKAAERAALKRFVHVSSLAAREPGLSLYGKSKKRGEDVVRASALEWTIVRPPAVYGPHDMEMLDLFRAAKKGVVPMPLKGRTSIIHVSDLARLLLLCAISDDMNASCLEPDDGRPQGWEHGELARAIAAAVGRKAIIPRMPAPLLALAAKGDRLLRGDDAKLTSDRVRYLVHPNWVSRRFEDYEEYFWQPRIETGQGLAETARWYEAAGWL